MPHTQTKKQAAIAYELYRRHLGGRRPDGSPIPEFHTLPLSVQFGIEKVVNAALHYMPQKRVDG